MSRSGPARSRPAQYAFGGVREPAWHFRWYRVADQQPRHAGELRRESPGVIGLTVACADHRWIAPRTPRPAACTADHQSAILMNFGVLALALGGALVAPVAQA